MKDIIFMSVVILATFLVAACSSQPKTSETVYSSSSADQVFNKKQIK